MRDILQALRLARIDYVVLRPFEDGRAFVAVGCALVTMQKHAEAVGFNARRGQHATELDRRLHANTHCVPHSKYVRARSADYELFCSRDRLRLLSSLLEASEAFGGAGLDLTLLLHQRVLTDHYALHHAVERRVVYAAWSGRRYVPPVWPPQVPSQFVSEEATVPSPGGQPLARYAT